MKLAVNNPNLSVILPVGCNAKCDFCYWKQNKGLTTYIFEHVATTLPKPLFSQVSITGGETTLASDLIGYLKIARNNFNKVVLNSNGYNIYPEIFNYIDYLNISRHHYLDKENYKVFKTETVPDTDELKYICSLGDVTLNCVLPDKFDDKKFITNYIDYAKRVGAKVVFRKYFNNLDILGSIDTDETLISQHSCPACLHRVHNINDVQVTFKYSVQETCEAIDGIYELILQPNGDLTIDWAGKIKLSYKEV